MVDVVAHASSISLAGRSETAAAGHAAARHAAPSRSPPWLPLGAVVAVVEPDLVVETMISCPSVRPLVICDVGVGGHARFHGDVGRLTVSSSTCT